MNEKTALATGARRTKEERERDLQDTARWILEGKSQQEIVALISQRYPFSLSPQSISNDVATLRKRWQARAFEDYSTHLGMTLARLDQVENALWRGYERSLQEKQTLLNEKRDDTFGGNGSGSYSKRMAKRKKETTYGDIRYLQEIHQIQKTRAKLLGLNAPEKISMNWRLEAKLETGMTDAQIDQAHEELVQFFMDQQKKYGYPDKTSPPIEDAEFHDLDSGEVEFFDEEADSGV